MLDSTICLIDRTLSGATTPGQSFIVSNIPIEYESFLKDLFDPLLRP